MSVVSVEAVYDREGSIGSDWRRTYRRAWIVITNDKNDGAKTVRESLPVSIGNSYVDGNDSDRGAFCQSIRVTNVTADGLQWTAAAEYGPYDATVNPQNPTERPIKVSWSRSQFERVADFDQDGKAIVNSAGSRFDPTVMIDDSRSVLTITRCESTYDEDLASNFRDAINRDAFFNYDPYFVKVMDITAELTRDPDIGWYWVVTYQFAINRDGWRRKILDIGFEYINPAGSKVKIVDAKGQPVADARLLDGQGALLASAADPVALEFKVFKELSFELLNLTRDMIPKNS